MNNLRTILVLALPLGLAACLLPTRFTADMDISAIGEISFAYEGEVALVAGRADLRADPKRQGDARWEDTAAALRRDPTFRTVRYVGDALYDVEVVLDHDLHRQGNFRFLDFFTARRRDDVLEIRSIGVERNVIDQLTALGLGVNGVLSIRPNGTVLSHNADVEPTGTGGAYVWKLRNLGRSVRMTVRLPDPSS